MRIADLISLAASRDAGLVSRLAAVYAGNSDLAADACARIASLARHYASSFGASGDVAVVRAPGRVNLIGEHTDYNGLPVMPMAISRDVLIVAGGTAGRTVRITNTDNGFPDRVFTIERRIPPYQPGDWANYIKSATQGLIDFWNSDDGIHGFDMATSGNVPIASGLSSSAAFTIASALALLATHQRSIEPVAFADTMAKSDHYVGMASGGMDQATSVLGQPGSCLRIDFHPLRIQAMHLPAATTVVVCHSRVKAAKAGNARDEYNRRVVECRLAVALLHKLGGHKDAPTPTLLSEWRATHTAGHADALGQIARLLHIGGYRFEELAQLLGISRHEVSAAYCATPSGAALAEPSDGFQLKRRSRHVISEAHRVDEATAVLGAGEADAASQFGALMNASHESCRSDYGISCAELDALVGAARDAGAFGARLTGAGFGGCTVNLVRAGSAPAFFQKINEAYYRPKGLDALADNLFEFSPASGAGVLIT